MIGGQSSIDPHAGNDQYWLSRSDGGEDWTWSTVEGKNVCCIFIYSQDNSYEWVDRKQALETLGSVSGVKW